MDDHQTMVGAPVAWSGICVHHIKLPPEVVPVLGPAVMGFQPASPLSPWFTCLLIRFHACSGCIQKLLFIKCCTSQSAYQQKYSG